jgi:two-component system sensor histidine kinase/response regulator
VSSALGDARDLIDIALDAIIAIDERGVIVEWNRGAESTFGWTRDAALGRRLADTIVPERYREAHTRGLAHYIATGEGPLIGKRVEIEALHHDGRELPVEISILARRAEGAYTFVAFVRDITDRRAGEHAIRESARLLERDRARSELLANVSHELRTPLNAVLGFTELLDEQVGPSLSDAQRRYLRNVRDAGTGLLDLVNDVLELSTLAPGPSALNLETIDLVALLSPVVAEARRAADQKGLELRAGAIPSATVSIDPRRLRRVLDDLVSNAVKFTPAGFVSLSFATEGRALTLEVADTGIGIPAELHPKVFAMFERIHEGRHASAGTGLGLHLVQRIVELHAGTITLCSEGRGTTFTIRLPDAVRAGDDGRST